MTSILKVSEIQDPTNSNTAFTIGTDGRPYPKAGGIVQTQYTQIDATSIISCASQTDTEISALAVNITPVSTNSIIKIEAMVNGEWADQSSVYNSVWFFYRDSTKLSAPAAGNRNVGILMASNLTYNGVDADSTPETARPSTASRTSPACTCSDRSQGPPSSIFLT